MLDVALFPKAKGLALSKCLGWVNLKRWQLGAQVTFGM